MSEQKILRCNRCGCAGVRWEKTQAGKWYLAVDAGVLDDPAARRYAAVARKRPHSCTSHPDYCGGKCREIQRFARMDALQARIAAEVAEDEANAAAFRAEMDRQYAMVGWTDEMAQAEREAEARAFLSDPDLRCGHEECDMEPCSLQGTLPRPPRGAALSEIRAWDKSQAAVRMARIRAREMAVR